jgi:hypothetical protein
MFADEKGHTCHFCFRNRQHQHNCSCLDIADRKVISAWLNRCIYVINWCKLYRRNLLETALAKVASLIGCRAGGRTLPRVPDGFFVQQYWLVTGS